MTTYTVSSGNTSSGITLEHDDSLVVSGGGRAVDITSKPGGLTTVYSGGVLSAETLSGSSGDFSRITLSGGSAYDVEMGSYVELYAKAGSLLSGGQVALYANLYASSGATISAFKAFGGTVFASNGAHVEDTLVSSQGRVWVSSGGIASNTTVIGSGTPSDVSYANILVVDDGGVANNATLTQGGRAEIHNGGVASNFTQGTNAFVTISSGGTLSRDIVSSGGSLFVQEKGVISGATVSQGGSAVFSSGGILSGTLSVMSGGRAVVNGTVGSGLINLAGDGSELTISGTDMPTNTISGFSTNDKIDLASVRRSDIKSISRENNQITVSLKNGTNYRLNAPGANNYGYELLDDGNGGTVYTTCFAAGTMIATPDGEVAVENLEPGAKVKTPKGAMPIKWVGHRSITVARQKVPEENWLVRLKAGALSDGVPSRDLLVTQEHCMVFENRLVPARMLVNGVSVLLDRSIAEYTYYHVELETHEAIWAEGALTESYLDTGNRDQFDNNPVTALFPQPVASASDDLPLDTSRAFVEPIYNAIAARAGVTAQPVATTDDADLHLVTDAGMVIEAHRVQDDQHIFRLPEGVESGVLVSRTSRPSEMIGPFVDDRRDLGVLIGEVKLFSADRSVALEDLFTDPSLPGWDVCEASHCRWTNGAAVLPLGRDDGPRLLSVKVLAKGPYQDRSGQHIAAA